MHHGFLLMTGLSVMVMGCSSRTPAVKSEIRETPHPQIVRSGSRDPGYTWKEMRVTGHIRVGRNEIVPDIRVEGLDGPDGEPLEILSPLPLATFGKLDPRKRYQVVFYLEEQARPGRSPVHAATLSKVREAGAVIVDASICDVHHRSMRFLEADNINYGFDFEKENRALEKFHNHGYFITRGDKFGWEHQWEWRCPDCAGKVAAFRAKIDS